MALGYIAGNIEVNYVSMLLAFDEIKQAETFLSSIGKIKLLISFC